MAVDASAEVSHWDGYDYVLVNDEVEKCFDSVHTIVRPNACAARGRRG